MHNTKVATCCYCGTRAALVLTGKDRHELACSSCGAPLHDLKMLPKARVKGAVGGEGDRVKHAPHRARVEAAQARRKPKKTKKKKSFKSKMFEEIWDVVEDIFD